MYYILRKFVKETKSRIKKTLTFYCKSILDVQCCANKNTLKTLHYQIGNLLQITPTSDVALESNKQGRICQKEGKK